MNVEWCGCVFVDFECGYGGVVGGRDVVVGVREFEERGVDGNVYV